MRPLVPKKKPPSSGQIIEWIMGLNTSRMEVTVPNEQSICIPLRCDWGKGKSARLDTVVDSLQKRMNDLEVSKQLNVALPVKRNGMITPSTSPAWLHSESGDPDTAW
mmetsp:Transcript_35828/g.82686  ORF Transcript_35828/g.82686 Transcript_35828/m.82686 type:complete len:107 (-) Transcript_35828:480-800(-)